MSLTASGNSGSSFEPIPAGTYAAVCYMLVDLGMQETEYKGTKKTSQKCQIGWEIPELTMQTDGEDVPRVISKRYTVSLNERAALRQDLAAWRGRDFTEEELAGFDLRNVVGAPCLIQINHQDVNGKTYSNIQSIMAMPRGMEKPKPTGKKIIYDIDADPTSAAEFLPEWLRKIVKESESYQKKVLEEANGKTGFEEMDAVDGELPF